MKPFIPPHQRKGKNGFDFNEENSTFEPRATQDIMDPKENFWDSWLVIIQIFGMSMFWAQGVKHALLDAMCCSVLNNYCFIWESECFGRGGTGTCTHKLCMLGPRHLL